MNCNGIQCKPLCGKDFINPKQKIETRAIIVNSPKAEKLKDIIERREDYFNTIFKCTINTDNLDEAIKNLVSNVNWFMDKERKDSNGIYLDHIVTVEDGSRFYLEYSPRTHVEFVEKLDDDGVNNVKLLINFFIQCSKLICMRETMYSEDLLSAMDWGILLYSFDTEEPDRLIGSILLPTCRLNALRILQSITLLHVISFNNSGGTEYSSKSIDDLARKFVELELGKIKDKDPKEFPEWQLVYGKYFNHF